MPGGIECVGRVRSEVALLEHPQESDGKADLLGSMPAGTIG